MDKLQELRNRQAECVANIKGIRAEADNAKRDLTDDEVKQCRDYTAEFNTCENQIGIILEEQRMDATLSVSEGRQTEPDNGAPPVTDNQDGQVPARTQSTTQTVRNTQTPVNFVANEGRVSIHGEKVYLQKCGFRNLGEMAWAVKEHKIGGKTDSRLFVAQNAAATTFGTEADLGWAIPPDFRRTILEAVNMEASLASRTDQIPVSGNTFTAPVDETTDWGTDGVQAYWGSEGGTKTQSKPILQDRTTKLGKLYCLVPMSDESLEDAPAMDAYLRRKAPAKIRFKLNLAIVQGDGVGKPLGILNSPATISVAKETSQAADTLVGANIIKMWSRMPQDNRANAVWLINQDIEPMLYTLSVPGKDNTGAAVTGWGTHVYIPPNGLSQSPYGTLMGRPVIATQAAETLGDKGDIILADLTQYMLILKSGENPKTDVSIHLWFDQDITAFRFVLRVNGQPWLSGPIPARDGSATYSPFVTLDERA